VLSTVIRTLSNAFWTNVDGSGLGVADITTAEGKVTKIRVVLHTVSLHLGAPAIHSISDIHFSQLHLDVMHLTQRTIKNNLVAFPNPDQLLQPTLA
jgi:hypothetical protein